MNVLLESDFRSPEPRLAHILPGRELESVQFAIQCRLAGQCDGIFVQGPDIRQWSFLEEANGFDEYVFTDVDKSFSRADVSCLSGARRLSVAGVSRPVDFSLLSGLEALGYQWNSGSHGLERLGELNQACLWGIGREKNASPLLLPASVRHLELIRFGHTQLDLGEHVAQLDELHISRAKELTALPRSASIRSVELAFVGREVFDYASLPSDVEFLEISACSPIRSWAFLEAMTSLKSLVVEKTVCPSPSASDRRCLDRIENVNVPHIEPRSGDVWEVWREIRAGRSWPAPSV